MGYWGKRASTCRRCWQVGHTRRNCPSNPDYIKEDYARLAKSRKCNYCAETGHNRSSCEKRKIALAKFKKDEILRRQAIDQFYREHGIGVGAVLSYEIPAWANKSGQKGETDVLLLKRAWSISMSGDINFFFHSSTRAEEIQASIGILGMMNEWGAVNIPWCDSAGCRQVFSFYCDYKVEVLTPGNTNGSMYSYSYLHDESTVTDIPADLSDTVRSKKE